MKKIILFSGLILFNISGVFAQAQDLTALIEIVSSYPIITAVVVIAHICLTIAVYKMKGGIWACFYFFLAPVVLFLLLAFIGGASGRKSRK
jgi:hypothetical protein